MALKFWNSGFAYDFVDGLGGIAARSNGQIVVTRWTADGSYETGQDDLHIQFDYFDFLGTFNFNANGYILGRSDATVPVVTLSDGYTLAFGKTRDVSATDRDFRVTTWDDDYWGEINGENIIYENSSSSYDLINDLIARADGGIAVVYARQGTNFDDDIRLAVVNENGAVLNDLVANSTTAGLQQNATVAQLANGNFVVGWTDRGDITGSISPAPIQKMRIFDSDGNPLGYEQTVSISSNGAFPDIVALKNGNFVITWQDVNEGYIFYMIFKAGGEMLTHGAERVIGIDPFSIVPKLIALNDGGFLMGWDAYLGTETDGSLDGDVVFRRFDASGTQIGDELRIDLPGDQTLGSMTLTPDGRVAFTYSSETGDSTDIIEHFVRFIDPRDGSLFGTNDDDNIAGRHEATTIHGLGGQDHLVGLESNDVLLGGNGSDTLRGGKGADHMIGGKGIDNYIVDNTGDTTIESKDQGYDTVRSSVSFALLSNVEQLILTGGKDINATGNGLANTVIGNSGNNRLDGRAGADTLDGGSGADTLTGGEDADILLGNGGADTINGGAGDDTLIGGTGKDILTGGTGKDFFVFNTALSASTNVDTIIDFQVDVDKVQLENAIFTVVGASLTAEEFVANASGTAANGSQHILYDTTDGRLFYDADGNGGQARVQFATLNAGLALDHLDFLVI